jgi:hypothetical protein
MPAFGPPGAARGRLEPTSNRLPDSDAQHLFGLEIVPEGITPLGYRRSERCSVGRPPGPHATNSFSPARCA